MRSIRKINLPRFKHFNFSDENWTLSLSLWNSWPNLIMKQREPPVVRLDQFHWGASADWRSSSTRDKRVDCGPSGRSPVWQGRAGIPSQPSHQASERRERRAQPVSSVRSPALPVNTGRQTAKKLYLGYLSCERLLSLTGSHYHMVLGWCNQGDYFSRLC